MMTFTPLHKITITPQMESAPRSCTGWSCSCSAPYGFGENRNKICHVYGPSFEADPKDVEKHHRCMRAKYLKMKSLDYTARVDKVNRLRMEIRRSRMLQKMRETLDWHLDFEDQVRTQNFFEMRDREMRWQREDEETRSWWKKRAETAAEWDRYREAELASSARSIRNLMKDF